MRRLILTLSCTFCLISLPATGATAAIPAGATPFAEAGGTGTGAGLTAAAVGGHHHRSKPQAHHRHKG